MTLKEAAALLGTSPDKGNRAMQYTIGTPIDHLAKIQHPYSPSWTPSVDGQECLWRERLDDGTYSLRPCHRPEREHDPRFGVDAK